MATFYLDTVRVGIVDRIVGFKMVKEEGDKEFEIEFDDGVLSTIATSMGWRGDPGIDDDDAVLYLKELVEVTPEEMDFVGVAMLWDELGGKEVERQEYSKLLAGVLVDLINESIDGYDEFPENMEVIVAEHRDEGGSHFIDLHIDCGPTVTIEVKW